MAGGINVAKNLEQDYPKVSGEWVLQQDPDVILISAGSGGTLGYTTENYDEASKLRDMILRNKIFANMNVVKNEQVYVIRGYGSCPYVNAQFLAKWIYPERFKDVEPEKALKEYFEKWLGVPFNGCWVYPSTIN